MPTAMPVYLKDIWPSAKAVAKTVRKAVKKSMFRKRYGNVFEGDKEWQDIEVTGGLTYGWDKTSTYVQNPPYFTDLAHTPKPVTDIVNARILGLFLDSITTDHISPAGAIRKDSPAGQLPHRARRRSSRLQFLRLAARQSRGDDARHVRQHPHQESDGQGRRGRRHACITLQASIMPIYDAAMRYAGEGVPLVVFAGKEYGTGSSRDWAAKGPRLLGVRAVIAESFERIHRSNLIGMGDPAARVCRRHVLAVARAHGRRDRDACKA